MSLRALFRAARPALLASLLAAAATLLSASTLHAQLQLSTEAQAPASLNISAPLTGVSFGQIFTVAGAADQRLESFRLSLRTAETMRYRARLLRWEGTRAGALLWESAERTSPATPTTTSPSYLTFLPDAVLAGGGRYVFLLSLETPTASSVRTFTSGGSRTPNPYDGGNQIYKQSAALTALQAKGEWFGASGVATDLGFSANFVPPTTTAPEPATLALLIPGLLAVGAVRRARRG